MENKKVGQLCYCKCGYYAKPGNKYIYGHNRKGKKQPPFSEEFCKAASERMKGKSPSNKNIKNTKARKRLANFLRENRNKHFCNCKCGGKIRIKRTDFYYSISRFLPGHNKGMLGKKQTLETIEKIRSKIIGKQYGLGHTVSKVARKLIGEKNSRNKNLARKSQENMTKKILENGGKHPNISKYKKGKYFSYKNQVELYYDSSYELQTYMLLEQASKITSYRRCDFYIEYGLNNKIRRYFPDILIEYVDGDKEVIEIKPLGRIYEKQNQAKFEAAYKYCKDRGMIFTVWTERDIFGYKIMSLDLLKKIETEELYDIRKLCESTLYKN